MSNPHRVYVGARGQQGFSINHTSSTNTTTPMSSRRRNPFLRASKHMSYAQVRGASGYTRSRKRWASRLKGGLRRYYKKLSRPPKPERKYIDFFMPGSGGSVAYPLDQGYPPNTFYNPFDAESTIYSNTSGNPFADKGLLVTKGIVQGSGDGQRIGKKIMVDTISVCFHLAPNIDESKVYATGAVPTGVGASWNNRWNYIIRFMLLVDTVPNYSNNNGMVMSDLFEHATDTTWAGGNVWSPLRMDTAKRFRVIKDQILHIDLDSGQRNTIKFSKKIRIPVTFKGTGGNQVDTTHNQIWILLLHDGIVSSDFANSNLKDPRLIGGYRIRYYDN